MRELFKEKLDFKNPIIDILIAVVIGIITFVILEKAQEGVALFAIPILVFLFFIYDKKCFGIILCFIILGFISMNYYYSFGENREGIFAARIESAYKDYYIASSKGREFFLYSDKSLEVNEKVVFKGKFKREIDMERGRVGHLFVKDIIKVEKDVLYKIRNLSSRYYEDLKEKIGEGKSAIATALIFGDKDYLEKSAKEDLKDTGVLHLVCISGFHIVFIYSILRKFLPKITVIPITFLYVFITGLTASGMRAYIMLVVLELSLMVKRNYNSLNGLALSAVLLLIFNPSYIADVGFYLSYFATLGILLLSGKLQQLLYFMPNCIATSLALSLSAQVFIYPIMIIYFGSFSLNFILGSFILTPIIYLLLPLGLISLIVFVCGISITILDKLMSLGFSIFNLIIEYLKYYAVESYYASEIFVVVYILLLGYFYLIYKGYLDIKYYRAAYSSVVIVFIGMFTLMPTVSVYTENFSNAIIVRQGLEKIAYTNSESEYFKMNLQKEHSVNDIRKVDENISLYLDDETVLLIKPDIDESFIMLRDNNYGIIDLLNKDENLVLIKNRIYINERGK
ncbi:MAG: ComEC/Rec2 family competence protein [Sarcina sp.]